MEAKRGTGVWQENDPHKSARLPERLEGGLSNRLILVVAPAKSGKTALLRQWAGQGLTARAYRIAWITITPQDNTPEAFLANLASALQVNPYLQENTSIAPEYSTSFYLEDSFIELINGLASLPGEIVLVLDNYHLIEAPAIHKAVGLMLDYLPSQAHLVIASQTEPPLPIARLRVRRQVLEIGLPDLKLVG
jgi:LuxR family maltose regulon positive regulatory protein